jgi:hypothetical protein
MVTIARSNDLLIVDDQRLATVAVSSPAARLNLNYAHRFVQLGTP